MAKIFLGVDIGLRYINLIYSSGVGEKIKVLKYSSIDTPDDCFNEEEINNPIEIGRLISEDIAKSGFSPVSFSICLNEKAATIREIHLSNLKKNEISSAIAFELSQIYPGIMGTSTVSYKTHSHINGEFNGIAAFCQNKVLSSYVQLANTVDIRLKNIDVNSNACVKAIRHYAPSVLKDKAVLLVDIGEYVTNVSFVLNENLLLSRTINNGMNAVWQNIADNHNLTIKEAEEAYKNHGLQNLGIEIRDLSSYLRVGLIPVEQQVNQTLEFCRYTYPNNAISDIILLGGGCLFPGLPEYFSENFNVPSSCIYSDKIQGQIDYEAFTMFLPALGSLIYHDKKGVSDLNFVHSLHKEKAKYKKPIPLFVTLGIFILVTLIMAGNYLSLYLATKTLADEEKELNDKIASYSELSSVKKELNESAERVAVLSTIEDISTATGLSASNLLNVLAKMLPDEVFAISVSVSGDKTLSLNGKSSTREAIAYFINNLIGDELFEDVVLSSVVSTSMQNDTAVDYNFVISLKVKK